MIVVDASVVVDLLLGAGSEAGDDFAERLAEREPVAAPHLLDAEVAQVVRRFLMRGSVSRPLAVELLDDLASLPIRRYPHTALLPRAEQLWQNLTAYGALYLALAEALEAPLLTGDAAFSAVSQSFAEVVVRTTSG